MVDESTPSKSHFTTQIGPAAFLAVLQIVGIAAGGLWFLSAMSTKFDVAEQRIEAVHRDVKEVGTQQSANASRLSGVETAVTYLRDAVTRIDGKIK